MTSIVITEKNAEIEILRKELHPSITGAAKSDKERQSLSIFLKLDAQACAFDKAVAAIVGDTRTAPKSNRLMARHTNSAPGGTLSARDETETAFRAD